VKSEERQGHEEVMERLQKRDLSIYKTGGEQSEVVSVKEERVETEEVGDKAGEGSAHFLEAQDEQSQAEYEQGDYDDAYAEGYDDSQLGMFTEYEGAEGM